MVVQGYGHVRCSFYFTSRLGSPNLTRLQWFGVYSIDGAINAGLDLEMPGTNKWRSLDLVTRSIQSRKILPRTLKERARNVLRLVQKCAAGAPEVLDGDGEERTVDSPAHVKLMRHVAASSIVLLKNEDAILPLKPQEKAIKKVAIVGGNAIAISGGGSAALKPSFFVSPFDGIKNALGEGVEVTYAEGAVCKFNYPFSSSKAYIWS
jgi:beta-glucosidase